MIPAGIDAIGVAVVSWLLTYLIHSTILLSAAAAIAWRFSDHHGWLDLVWKAALLGPLVSATLQPGLAASPLAGQWSIADTPSIAVPAGATAPSTPVSVTPSSVVERSTPSTATRVEPTAAIDRGDSTPLSHAAADASSVRRWWPASIALSWLGIALIAVAAYLARLRRVYRTLAGATPISAAVPGRSPAIAVGVSDNCQVPLALAGRRIVLPRRLFDLDTDQQRAALAHEMAHVVRRDPEWLIAIELMTRVFFFQPLHRLARARVRDSAEFLCDQWAVRQTQSPLALAKCLSEVAGWCEGDRLLAGVSAMARNDSAMVKRVNRILNGATDSAWRPRAWWLAIPVALVSLAAPRVAASNMTAAVTNRINVAAPSVDAASVLDTAKEDAGQQRRDWTPSEIAAARAQLQVIRPARPDDPLGDRWRWAISEASRRRLSDFWVVYMFVTPTHAGNLIMSDMDGSFISSDGRISSSGPHLAMLDGTVRLEGGNLAVLVRYRGGAIDRAGYRSVGIGFDFGRTPVFWLGHAPETESFARVRDLFNEARGEQLQSKMIDLASIHSDSNVVIPFLTSLVDSSRPAAIRSEAAEGFEHHHDPRSVQVLLRVARADIDSEVRSEAAEAIGAVQAPESIAALTELVDQSPDPEVRREAAEAFGDQPAARALPAIEQVVAASRDEDVLGEAIEALAEIEDAQVVDILSRIANTHPLLSAQLEAVETLGDRHDDAGAVAALERIAREHPREDVQAEALETLADAVEHAIHPVVLELAARGTTSRIRREALESIADSVDQLADVQALDAAQRVIARAIFDDPDASVREEALDALEQLPADRALSILRDVIERHPDAQLKREAGKQLRERQ
jgi:HEAT repeat protein/beta-lactamase regulating signal transducer with metallopeptidase domain